MGTSYAKYVGLLIVSIKKLSYKYKCGYMVDNLFLE